jgi:hypothetical protein
MSSLRFFKRNARRTPEIIVGQVKKNLKHAIKMITQAKSWFFEKSSKTVKLLVRLSKKNTRSEKRASYRSSGN